MFVITSIPNHPGPQFHTTECCLGQVSFLCSYDVVLGFPTFVCPQAHMPFSPRPVGASVHIYERHTESSAKMNISVHNTLLVFYQPCNLID